MSAPQQRFWSSQHEQYYIYEATSDTFLLQDGRRFARPANIPRSAFTALPQQPLSSPPNYAPSPGSSIPNYVITSNTQQRQTPAQPQPGGTDPSRSQQRAQYPARASSSQVDALTDNLRSVTVSTQQYQPQPVTPVVSVGHDGRRVVEASDPTTKLRTLIQTAPTIAITDPELLQQGIYARSRIFPTDNESVERLFKSFRVRDQPKKFFTIGKVFIVLWVEPAGESNTGVTGLEKGTIITQFGERAFSKVRRFVVIREGDNYCSALPITSYGRRGVGKPGVNKSEHSIIHTTAKPPNPLPSELTQRDEDGMRPDAIRVDADDPIDKLDDFSRLDYGKVHTIQHNIKVKAFGKVNPKSMNALHNQFGNVWIALSNMSSLGQPKVSRAAETSAKASRDASAAQRRPSHSSHPQSGVHLPQTQATVSRGEERDTDAAARIQANARATYRRLVESGYSEQRAGEMVSERLAELRSEKGRSDQRGSTAVDGDSSGSEEQGDHGPSPKGVARGPSGNRHQAMSDSSSRGPKPSSTAPMKNTPPVQSSVGGHSSSSTGGQRSNLNTPPESRSAATRTTTHPPSQARSTGNSSAAQVAQNRARAEAMITRLRQEGKSQNEALEIVKQYFSSSK